MVDSTAQASSERGGPHLVLYDGVCGLCSRFLQFLIAHDSRAAFHFASLQSVLGRRMVEAAGGDPRRLTSFYVIANYRTPAVRTITKARAALFIAGELGWPWKLACAMGALPTGVLDRAYDLVARNRYRIFGRRERCLTPPPAVRNRFVE
jgi:predicted DCC family thiol-disulfide oxidoreductase YuxK